MAQTYGALGLAYLWRRAEQYEGAIAKFFSEAELSALTDRLGVQEGDCVCFTAGTGEVPALALGAVRLHAARRFGWIPRGVFDFLWITEFPLFERSGRWQHQPHAPPLHPTPSRRLAPDQKRPAQVRSRAYDIVCNGVELGSGSLRITRPEQQQAIFAALGLTPRKPSKSSAS